jgi:hypothetical protein
MSSRRRALRPVVGAIVAVLAAGSLSATAPAAARPTATAFPAVSDPSGLTATTTLTFSRSQPDRLTLSWPDTGDAPDQFRLTLESYEGDETAQLDSAAIGCDGARCSWSGEVEDISSGDTAHVDILRLINGGTDIEQEIDRFHGPLLPADTEKPKLKVKIPKRTVPLAKAIRLKVKFSDDQTEFGWFGDDCAPGGDCYHPDWYAEMSVNKGKKWKPFTDLLFARKPGSIRVWIRFPDEALNMSKIYKSPKLTWTKKK